MKKIAILGSTGSIGTQTLEVVRENRDIEVTALAAGSNIGLLEAQIRKFHPVLAAVWDEAKAKELRENVKDLDVKVVSGMDGLIEVAVQQDVYKRQEQSCQSGVSGNLFHKWVPPVLNFVCLVKECKIGRVYIPVTDLVKEHQRCG